MFSAKPSTRLISREPIVKEGKSVRVLRKIDYTLLYTPVAQRGWGDPIHPVEPDARFVTIRRLVERRMTFLENYSHRHN